MNKHLKYLISLFLAFVVIANDCTLDSQSKVADYYQSSYLVLRTEIDFRNIRLYKFAKARSFEEFSFPVLLAFLGLRTVFSFQTRIILKLCKLLYQNINSYIRQSVFINELIISSYFHKSLYSA